ncbi:hypothetical protein HDU97_009901 [Phlyctochytrium planicorne]|nr:hypothetical protein HDU97_009901 [Phlyctochytrium planicorne]
MGPGATFRNLLNLSQPKPSTPIVNPNGNHCLKDIPTGHTINTFNDNTSSNINASVNMPGSTIESSTLLLELFKPDPSSTSSRQHQQQQQQRSGSQQQQAWTGQDRGDVFSFLWKYRTEGSLPTSPGTTSTSNNTKGAGLVERVEFVECGEGDEDDEAGGGASSMADGDLDGDDDGMVMMMPSSSATARTSITSLSSGMMPSPVSPSSVDVANVRARFQIRVVCKSQEAAIELKSIINNNLYIPHNHSSAYELSADFVYSLSSANPSNSFSPSSGAAVAAGNNSPTSFSSVSPSNGANSTPIIKSNLSNGNAGAPIPKHSNSLPSASRHLRLVSPPFALTLTESAKIASQFDGFESIQVSANALLPSLSAANASMFSKGVSYLLSYTDEMVAGNVVRLVTGWTNLDLIAFDRPDLVAVSPSSGFFHRPSIGTVESLMGGVGTFGGRDLKGSFRPLQQNSSGQTWEVYGAGGHLIGNHNHHHQPQPQPPQSQGAFAYMQDTLLDDDQLQLQQQSQQQQQQARPTSAGSSTYSQGSGSSGHPNPGWARNPHLFDVGGEQTRSDVTSPISTLENMSTPPSTPPPFGGAKSGPGGARTIYVTNLGGKDKADLKSLCKQLPGFVRVQFGQTNFRVVLKDAENARESMAKITEMNHGFKCSFARKEPEEKKIDELGEPSKVLWTSTLYWSEAEFRKYLQTTYDGFEKLVFDTAHSWVHFRDVSCSTRALEDMNTTTNLYSVYSKKFDRETGNVIPHHQQVQHHTTNSANNTASKPSVTVSVPIIGVKSPAPNGISPATPSSAAAVGAGPGSVASAAIRSPAASMPITPGSLPGTPNTSPTLAPGLMLAPTATRALAPPSMLFPPATTPTTPISPASPASVGQQQQQANALLASRQHLGLRKFASHGNFPIGAGGEDGSAWFGVQHQQNQGGHVSAPGSPRLGARDWNERRQILSNVLLIIRDAPISHIHSEQELRSIFSTLPGFVNFLLVPSHLHLHHPSSAPHIFARFSSIAAAKHVQESFSLRDLLRGPGDVSIQFMGSGGVPDGWEAFLIVEDDMASFVLGGGGGYRTGTPGFDDDEKDGVSARLLQHVAQQNQQQPQQQLNRTFSQPTLQRPGMGLDTLTFSQQQQQQQSGNGEAWGARGPHSGGSNTASPMRGHFGVWGGEAAVGLMDQRWQQQQQQQQQQGEDWNGNAAPAGVLSPAASATSSMSGQGNFGDIWKVGGGGAGGLRAFDLDGSRKKWTDETDDPPEIPPVDSLVGDEPNMIPSSSSAFPASLLTPTRPQHLDAHTPFSSPLAEGGPRANRLHHRSSSAKFSLLPSQRDSILSVNPRSPFNPDASSFVPTWPGVESETNHLSPRHGPIGRQSSLASPNPNSTSAIPGRGLWGAPSMMDLTSTSSVKLGSSLTRNASAPNLEMLRSNALFGLHPSMTGSQTSANNTNSSTLLTSSMLPYTDEPPSYLSSPSTKPINRSIGSSSDDEDRTHVRSSADEFEAKRMRECLWENQRRLEGVEMGVREIVEKIQRVRPDLGGAEVLNGGGGGVAPGLEGLLERLRGMVEKLVE